MHITPKFAILNILGVQFSGTRHIHIVLLPSSLFIYRTLFLLQIWNFVPCKQ